VNPFEVLGLPARADLADDQVRAAWKTIAAATHPDQPGGGDIGRYTAAAQAYAQLRTGWGRSEAYADLAIDQPRVPERLRTRGAEDLARSLMLIASRIRYGRPRRLAVRALAAAGLSLLVLALIPGQAAGPAIVTGLVTWFFFTGRGDLAPPPGR
jgi:hypothetical protein